MSIGLPVYNGEQYLAAAIESILRQTFGDFELILCDNASTDQTEAICRRYAGQDHRVRYHRNESNLGACPNFNLAVSLARGELFKWAAHDDRLEPTYLEKCVAELDRDSSAISAHCDAVIIDANDRPLDHRATGPDGNDFLDPQRQLDAASEVTRFAEILLRTRWCFEMFGVTRTASLRRTPLLLSFYGSDRVLLAALALAGRFAHVNEPLFLRRFHPQQSSARGYRQQVTWIDSRRQRVGLPPQVRCGWEFLRLLRRADLTLVQKLAATLVVVRWGIALCRLVIRQRNERGFLHRTVFSRFTRSQPNEPLIAH